MFFSRTHFQAFLSVGLCSLVALQLEPRMAAAKVGLDSDTVAALERLQHKAFVLFGERLRTKKDWDK